MLYLPVTIQQVHEEIRGFKTFTFHDHPRVPYLPGQYLTFAHQTLHGEIRRSYSITSTPYLNEPLSIGVKRIENGAFSRHLIDHIRPGDQLMTTGAGGFFVLPDNTDAYDKIFFLAAGSGITPIYSLLKTVLFRHPEIHVVLAYSNHSPESTIFYTALPKLQAGFKDRFHLQFYFSNARNLSGARLHRESITELLRTYGDKSLKRSLFYICGPESYMRMCLYSLQEEKVPRDHIKKEDFIITPRPVYKALPPDKTPRRVQVISGNETFSFIVHYPDSILEAAKKAGFSLPYSCEAGRCGSCAAKCKSGKIWLSYNEVLTDRELGNGLTLTCVGHPVGDDVVLII